MNDDAIQDLLVARKASCGFEVSCSGHHEEKHACLASLQASFHWILLSFFTVRIAPKIFVLETIDEFYSPNFNPEFEDSKFSLSPEILLHQPPKSHIG